MKVRFLILFIVLFSLFFSTPVADSYVEHNLPEVFEPVLCEIPIIEVSYVSPIINPEPVDIPAYTEEDLYWLAKIVYAEAFYDEDEGQQAVANVVLNRVDHPDFPDTIYDVIWQRTGKTWQFSPCGDGGINREPDERAIENARIVLEGKRDLPSDVLYFYMPTNGNRKDWIRTRKIYKKIGIHYFCY